MLKNGGAFLGGIFSSNCSDEGTATSQKGISFSSFSVALSVREKSHPQKPRGSPESVLENFRGLVSPLRPNGMP